MAAPVTRCAGCEVVLGPDDPAYDGHCASCAELFCPSLLDDPDSGECYWCGETVPVDELDDDATCEGCRDAEEYDRQRRADYRSMVL